MLAQRKIVCACARQVIITSTVDQSQGFAIYRWVLALFADLLWLLLFEEAFIKVMKLLVSILKANSVHLCRGFLSLEALLFNRSSSVDLWIQTSMTSYVTLTSLDHIFSVFPSWLKGFEYSVTLLDEINSLLHVASHSVTVTNCPNDQFMKSLLPLYM